MRLSVEWTQLRRELVSLKICLYKLPKLKNKESIQYNIQELWDSFKKFIYIYYIYLLKEEERKKRNKKEYWKQIKDKNKH